MASALPLPVAPLPPLPTGPIKVAASQFLLWAHANGVLAPDAYFPGDAVGVANFGPDPVSPVAVSALRQRQVRFVGVNASDLSILVYLKRSAPTAREMKVLPSTCNGYRLRYHQGNPNAVSPAAVAESSTACSVHTAAQGNFYTCGSSISVGNARSAGTLGSLLRDVQGKLYGLSNNHVSASCNYAPAGLPIIAPGVLDVSPLNPRPFTLGMHTRQLPMQMGDPSSVDILANTDAAVFELVDGAPVSSKQRNFYDTPSTVMDLVPGMIVEKVGRSSEWTRGVVHSEVIGALPISYSAPQYEFSGQVYFEPLFVVYGVGDRFSEGGDSGSLVVHVDAAGVRHGVGLVVAGCDDSSAPGGKRSFILPLRNILDRLQLSLVSNHNC